jgi:cysteinyl-tRNA synthetase
VVLGGRVVADWGYQLQGRRGAALSLAALGASAYDLLVVDYSADGSAAGEFSAAQVAALRNSPGGEKLVLAYLSLGEAEDYRFYWDPAWVDRRGRPGPRAPAWLARVNAQWDGNYKVRYWDPAWQRLVFGAADGPAKSYLDRILDQGFDGVYLDLIDAFEYFGPGGPQPERPAAAAEMVDLVAALAQYARGTRGRPGFLVVPQNGAAILRAVSEPAAQRYLEAVDAIGAEDTFFFGPRPENNRYRPQVETIADLGRFQAAGKPVFAVDYLTQRAKIDRFTRAAEARGYLPFATVRALDRLPAGQTPGGGSAAGAGGISGSVASPASTIPPSAPCAIKKSR